jgi:hypothetical protein
MAKEARMVGRIFKIEPQHGPAYMVVEIKIDCPFCGIAVIELAGHHLKAIRDIVIEAIDLHPELTSPEPEKIDSYELRTTRPKDPSRN